MISQTAALIVLLVALSHAAHSGLASEQHTALSGGIVRELSDNDERPTAVNALNSSTGREDDFATDVSICPSRSPDWQSGCTFLGGVSDSDAEGSGDGRERRLTADVESTTSAIEDATRDREDGEGDDALLASTTRTTTAAYNLESLKSCKALMLALGGDTINLGHNGSCSVRKCNSANMRWKIGPQTYTVFSRHCPIDTTTLVDATTAIPEKTSWIQCESCDLAQIAKDVGTILLIFVCCIGFLWKCLACIYRRCWGRCCRRAAGMETWGEKEEREERQREREASHV